MRITITVLTVIVFTLWFLLAFSWFLDFKRDIFVPFISNLFGEKTGNIGASVYVPIDKLNKEIQKAINLSIDENGYNTYVSDLIGPKRSIPKVSPEFCVLENIQEDTSLLPKVSVIICFHDEHLTVLLRTVNSLLKTASSKLLKEVIIVDDFSVQPKLENSYWDDDPRVKVIILEERKGLAKCRNVGVAHSTAEVLIFVDSNNEFPEGWLQPLLREIELNENSVVSPVLDVIDPDTFEYRVTSKIYAGGFNWNLKFKWLAILPQEDESLAIAIPVLPGGVFTITKSFFTKLNGFDEEMKYVGGDVYEMSFKTWMCGGIVKVVPCSHVGHVFRNKIPENLLPDRKFLQENLLRVAASWMDDYIGYFYERTRIHNIKRPEVSKQLQLRKDLNCHSFDWYLKNVYPSLYIPSDSKLRGQFRNWDFMVCLTAKINPYLVYNDVILDVYCEKNEGSFWLLTPTGQIRQDDFCLERQEGKVYLKLCISDSSLQKWTFESETNHIIAHDNVDLCLGVFLNTNINEREIGLKVCQSEYFGPKWTIDPL